MIIAMWSGPRNLSTAMMYSFGARPDTEAFDEPFYASFLAETGLDHPMGDKIMEVDETDPMKVVATITGEQGKPVRYLKVMTHHMVEAVPRDWFDRVKHVFLIRHPARVIASYQRKREQPTFEDLGFAQQNEILAQVEAGGHDAIVIDSDDVLRAPEKILPALCAALGLTWMDEMLAWPKGPKPFDGVWAPHWYNAVHQSTGFGAPPADPPQIDGSEVALFEQAMPLYSAMRARSLSA